MSIIMKNVKLGLNIIGAWPGVTASKFFFVVFGMFIISLIFQIWNTVAVVRELDLLMNNLGTTMPLTSVVLKLSAFRLKHG